MTRVTIRKHLAEWARSLYHLPTDQALSDKINEVLFTALKEEAIKAKAGTPIKPQPQFHFKEPPPEDEEFELEEFEPEVRPARDPNRIDPGGPAKQAEFDGPCAWGCARGIKKGDWIKVANGEAIHMGQCNRERIAYEEERRSRSDK